MSYTKVSNRSPDRRSSSPLPQYSYGAVAAPSHTHQTSLEKHEKLRRLGEAATDVLCAGMEALFDRWATQRMASGVHRVTKSMQTTSHNIFQAPYHRLHAMFIEQQARMEELKAHLQGDRTLPQKLNEQAALIEQLRSAIAGLEKRISDQQVHIKTLEAQVEEGKVHETRAALKDGEIATLVAELDREREGAAEQQKLIEELHTTVAELEELKGVIAARDVVIEDLHQQIAEDGEQHKSHIAEHEKMVASLQDELSPLRTRVEEQLAHISNLSVEAETGREHMARVAEQEALIKDLRDMLAADKLLETKVNEQDLILTELRGALTAGESELEHQKEHASLLQRELKGSETENASLRQKAEQLETELQAARARVKEFESKRVTSTPPQTPPPARRQSSTMPWYMNRYSSYSSGNGSS